MPEVYLGPDADRPAWDAQQARAAQEQQIRATIQQGLQAIRNASLTLDAVITGAGPIESYDPGTKTAVQILADVGVAGRRFHALHVQVVSHAVISQRVRATPPLPIGSRRARIATDDSAQDLRGGMSRTRCHPAAVSDAPVSPACV